jgi:nucleoside diphosphate kinase
VLDVVKRTIVGKITKRWLGVSTKVIAQSHDEYTGWHAHQHDEELQPIALCGEMRPSIYSFYWNDGLDSLRFMQEGV